MNLHYTQVLKTVFCVVSSIIILFAVYPHKASHQQINIANDVVTDVLYQDGLIPHTNKKTSTSSSTPNKKHNLIQYTRSNENANDELSSTNERRRLSDVEVTGEEEKTIGDEIVPDRKKNVILILAEDLRPQLSCYGSKTQTPNIDNLARKGFRFKYAFNQAPICSPSRASLMSGRYPDTSRVYQFETINPYQRKDAKKWADLGGAFKGLLGYQTYASGKLYHWNSDHKIRTEFDLSWPAHSKIWNRGCDRNYKDVGEYLSRPQENATHEFFDDEVADHAISHLHKALENKDKPFFLAVGWHQPHEPWHFPKNFWDMYNETEFPLTNGRPPKNMPPCATGDHKPQRAGGDYSASRYIKSILYPEFDGLDRKKYVDLYGEEPRFPEEIRREGIRAYSASISFMDSNVGRVLNEVKSLGIENDTIVVFSSDHGLNIGDYGMWGKRQLLDTSARVPLIVYDPTANREWNLRSGMGGGVSDVIVESIDLYPTLMELASGTKSLHEVQRQSAPKLQGQSLVKFMSESGSDTSERFAISQLPRCTTHINPKGLESWNYWGKCGRSEPASQWTGGKIEMYNEEDHILKNWTWAGTDGKVVLMGYSIRTQSYRYTAWLPWDGTTMAADWDYGSKWAEELYEHSIDEEDIIKHEYDGDLSAVETENILHENATDAVRSIAYDLFTKMKNRMQGNEGTGDHLFKNEWRLYPAPPEQSKWQIKWENIQRVRRALNMGKLSKDR